MTDETGDERQRGRLGYYGSCETVRTFHCLGICRQQGRNLPINARQGKVVDAFHRSPLALFPAWGSGIRVTADRQIGVLYPPKVAVVLGLSAKEPDPIHHHAELVLDNV